MKNKSIGGPISVAAALLFAIAAHAESPPQTPSQTAAPAAAATPQARPSPFGKARLVSDSTLQRIAGREDVSQVVIARNTGTVANNSIGDNSSTGTITFDGHAFEGMRGLSVLSANTGNNVSINASMNVNVAIRQ